jgi:hypothetical protein
VRLVLGGGLLLSSACAVEEWRNADLQLDVRGAAVHDEDLVRICVEGVGILEQAAGAGRLGFTGIPQGEDVAITVDLVAQVDTAGVGTWGYRVGPALLGADPAYLEVDAAPCAEGEDCALCATAGERAPEGQPDWLLAVRFLD